MNFANYKNKKPKIEIPTFLIQNVLIFLFLFCFTLSSVGYASPSMLCDFETGVNTNGPEGGGTGYFQLRGTYDPSPVASPGAVGTNYCIHETSSLDVSDHTFYMDNLEIRTLIEEAYGANRFRIWLKLPVGFSHAPDNNLQLGTYTRDPEIYSNEQGTHYYHYYNLQGSPYWTKIIANMHPCHWVGHQEDVVDNPTAPGWNYYDGFTRFYLEILDNNGMNDVYDWYLDEAEFYYEPEPENTVSINAVSCSYFGEGHFQLGWAGELKASNNHHYEVRYSTSPITNANYAQATLAPGCSDLTKVQGSYSWVKADFTIPVENGQIYYFAIKDLSSDNPYVTRIDYPVGDIPQGNQQPVANAGPDQTIADADNNGLEIITLDGSSSYDPDGTIESYVWKENSTQIASGMRPTVEFGVGIHDITLEVTDNEEASQTDHVTISVLPPSPTNVIASQGDSIDLTWNSVSGVAGYNVYRSTVSGSGYTKINFSLVTGTTYTDSNISPNVTYYYVVTSVIDPGLESQYSDEVSFTESSSSHSPIITSFTVTPSTVTIGDLVTFNVVATDEDGDDLTYIIDFGDGTSNGSGSQVVHTYTAAGIFFANVTVRDPGGLEVTSSLQVTVNDPSLPDGTITLQNGQDGYMGSDMRLLFSREPNTNYDDTWAGRVGEYAGVNRLVLMFDDLISQIPSNASIVSAHLNLHQYQNSGATDHVLDLFALNSSYSSDTVCWNSPWQVPGATGADDVESTELSSVILDNQVDVWREWDVTAYVQQVISGQRENLGFFIRSQNEENGHCRFEMDNDSDPNLRPKLLVTYSTDSDSIPPSDVSGFTATPGVGQVSLSWTNPTDSDFAGVMIRYRTDGTCPTSNTDGTAVPNGNGGKIPSQPNASGSYVHTGLDSNLTYYYSAFTYDTSENYSDTAHASARPLPPPNQAPVIGEFKAIPSSLNNPGETTTFNVSATDPDGDSLTYTIDFGDGTANGSGSHIVHKYMEESQDPFTATATVNDGHGHSVSKTIQVTVNNLPPVKPTGVSSNQ